MVSLTDVKKIEQEGEPKEKKRSSETEDHENSTWPLSKERSEVMKMSWREN